MKTKTTPDPADKPTLLSILTFSVGTQRYGLMIEDVVEVASMVEATTVKDAPPEVSGVVNRHGTVLSLLDLRLVFGLTPQSVDTSTLFVVAAHNGQQIGLVVDEVHQVEHVPASNWQNPSTTGNLIRGIISYKDKLVQIVSTAALVSTYLPGGIDDAEGNLA